MNRPAPMAPLASRTAPVARGVHWLVDGFRHFSTDWLAWSLAAAMLVAISLFLQVIPLLGSIALYLLSPVFMAGLMLGLADREGGRPFHASDLFRAFAGPHVGQLVVIGLLWLLLNAVALAVAVAVFLLFADVSFLTSLASSEGMLSAAERLTEALGLLLALLVYVSLLLPIAMMAWFAPALVVLEGEGAVAAMRHSLVACLRNVLPFTVYGLVGLLLFPVLLSALFWMTWLAVGMVSSSGSFWWSLGLTAVVAALVFVPVGMASIYCAYRDIFHRDINAD